ncbi:universal stress protein [Rhodococcus tibetensis]|uniref:Universal stress protein n=1 Tax=Rhodococcus tibetensis TaxID=2965064 RepID=A0ABT1Q6P2_9NOCA|nr:universal stress protein [Rhodococcus sp. FXJ9.536]MCQ4117921.1 universal stress protein [Rhodococcus sp. FXJ9.536]
MSTPASHSVVVGLDGSAASTAAATWGAAVAAKWGATLSLVHALPQDGPLYSPASIMLESQFLGQLREDGEAIIGTAKALLGQQYPDLEIETTISPGPAGTALLEAADWARLIVLGSTGAGAFRSVLLGSTALHVANRAECPVVVLRGEGSPPDERPVVVGVDGSELSGDAVSHAFEFASFFGASLVAVHTWQGSPTFGAGGTGMLVDWDAVKQEEAAVLSEGLAGESERYPDVPVTKVAQQGAAADVILQHAAGAQMIVVGSHGRGPLLGALMGSTSQNLLHHATVPVMICRS